MAIVYCYANKGEIIIFACSWWTNKNNKVFRYFELKVSTNKMQANKYFFLYFVYLFVEDGQELFSNKN